MPQQAGGSQQGFARHDGMTGEAMAQIVDAQFRRQVGFPPYRSPDGTDGLIFSFFDHRKHPFRVERGSPSFPANLLRSQEAADGRADDDVSRSRLAIAQAYAETVYSSQSKTYPRVFVLAPVGSPLVTGQNFYTAITRAEYSVTLWTEDRADLVDKLKHNTGQKTSSLEGMDMIRRSGTEARLDREAVRIQKERDLYDVQRRELALLGAERRGVYRGSDRKGLAGAGLRATETLTALIDRMLRNKPKPEISRPKEPDRTDEARCDRGRDR